jgi:nonsense-mediated mRNA decay protein 3
MAKTEDLEGRTKMEKLNAERDYELFLQDVEEDVELRGMMNLFKNAEAVVSTDHDQEMMGQDQEDGDGEDGYCSEEEPEADFPEINVDDLLDDIQEMKLDDEDDELVE